MFELISRLFSLIAVAERKEKALRVLLRGTDIVVIEEGMNDLEQTLNDLHWCKQEMETYCNYPNKRWLAADYITANDLPVRWAHRVFSRAFDRVWDHYAAMHEAEAQSA